jgi:hypothetical protein
MRPRAQSGEGMSSIVNVLGEEFHSIHSSFNWSSGTPHISVARLPSLAPPRGSVANAFGPPSSANAKQYWLNDVSVTAYGDTVRMSTGEERTGILILRAWVEDDDEHPLRVRITRMARDRVAEPITSASVTIEGICTLVQDWLEHLVDERK